MAIRKHIPNLLTLANVACGAAAVAFSFPHQGFSPTHISLAALLILLASVFDFLDGFAARRLQAYSAQGQVLDSLADLVSFGVAPGVLLFSLASNYLYASPTDSNQADWSTAAWLARLSCLLLPTAAAWRLSRFAADTTPRPYFQGLPAPAAGLFVALLGLLFNDARMSLWFLFEAPNNTLLAYSLIHPASLFLMNLILAGLMLSTWPMLSFKMKNLSWRQHRYHLIFLGLAGGLLVWLGGLAALPLGLGYLLCSLLARKTYRMQPATPPEPVQHG
jgi:CDP-diacylglycerol--serine O-phosphatidyltransferase